MADIGAITELVNNEKLLLKTGNDTFIMMQDCKLNLDRPIAREVTSGAGVVYFFGAGDNSIDFTLLLTTPELDGDDINDLIFQSQRDSNGKLPEQTYKIVATNVSGSSKTISATGTLPHLEIQRLAGVGGVQLVGRIQLTSDSVSVA
jgi:hypothetical protein